jgi:hypothetical protein
MNFRPWRLRLLRNPIGLAASILGHAYLKRGEVNPTLSFVRRTVDPRLVFDLESGRLNGVALGSALKDLRAFGVADSAIGQGNDYSLGYESIGLDVSLRADRIISFEISFDCMTGFEHPTRFLPCQGLTIIAKSRDFHLSRQSTKQELMATFGVPNLSDQCQYKYGIENVFRFSTDSCRVWASLDDRSGDLTHLEFATDSAA